MCAATFLSCSESGRSVIVKMAANLDRSAGGRSICSAMFLLSSNLPYLGFAAPRTAHLDWSVAVILALATDIAHILKAHRRGEVMLHESPETITHVDVAEIL